MTTKLERLIDQGVGRVPADIVLKGGRFFDLVTGELVLSDIAIGADRIVGTSGDYDGETEIDISGRIVVPGFIDTHLHIESSLVTPHEFDRCVLPYGVTTAICDPHEIANVLGTAGIEFFLESALETIMRPRSTFTMVATRSRSIRRSFPETGKTVSPATFSKASSPRTPRIIRSPARPKAGRFRLMARFTPSSFATASNGQMASR